MSEYYCDCSEDGYDKPQVYNQRVIKARTKHKCCECGDEIMPRSEYEKVTALYDGRWSTFYTCLICVKIRDDFCPNGYMHEGLAESLRNCLEVEL